MFTDLAAAVGISFTYFTVIYLTGTGGLFSERSGIVNIGLEGLMMIGTVTGAFGARYFTDTLGMGTVAGPRRAGGARRRHGNRPAGRRRLHRHLSSWVSGIPQRMPGCPFPPTGTGGTAERARRSSASATGPRQVGALLSRSAPTLAR